VPGRSWHRGGYGRIVGNVQGRAAGLLADGANVVLPKVGQNEKSIRKAMQGLREMGYKVDLVHVAATPEISGRRNIERMLKNGRLVSPDYITEVGDKPRKTYHLLKGEADDFADINTAVQPRETREASPGIANAFADGRHIVQGPLAGGRRGEAPSRAEKDQIDLPTRSLLDGLGLPYGS
jgi:hypothetical protein